MKDIKLSTGQYIKVEVGFMITLGDANNEWEVDLSADEARAIARALLAAAEASE